MVARYPALALVGALACAAPVGAHHALWADYREAEERTIEGVVVELVYRNPHSFVYVNAPGRTGEARVWAVECGPPRQIAAEQIERQLQPGDFVVVTGHPARDPGLGRLLMKRMLRPRDGRRWESTLRW